MDDYGLLAFLTGEYSESHVEEVRLLVESLQESRQWNPSPPVFLDEIDYSSCTNATDRPIRTIGLFLPLKQPWTGLPVTVEIQQYFGVEEVVKSIEELSTRFGVEFEFELGGVFVGDILSGKVSDLILWGLLGEWKKRLETS